MADPKKPGPGRSSLLLRATIEGYSGDTDPAHQVLQEWSVTAEVLWYDDEWEGSEQAGEARGYLIDLAELMNHPPKGLSLLHILDDEHQDLGELYEVFIDPETQHLREDLFPDSFTSRMIYVERLYVEPKWRGQKIGWVIAAHVSHLIGRNNALVVVIPRPLDVPGKDPRFEKLSPSLQRYYEGLGFRQALNSQFWWADPQFKPVGDRFFQGRTRVLYRYGQTPTTNGAQP
ncbi:MAG: GNAT family N-acetyltransferase [Bacillota bacterium]